jgi:hypothetical protein
MCREPCEPFRRIVECTSPPEMRRKLWQGLIPTEIRLADKDVATDRAPEPYYVFSSLHSSSYRLQIMLPRISFFAAAVPDVIEYFKEEALDVEPSIWFEFCGKPLRGCVRFSSLVLTATATSRLELSSICAQIKAFLGKLIYTSEI